MKGTRAMGMAAGQARLLSITARLSDNELRSQIISNNKMRLATKSSQVSEAYVEALNEAQYMFTNYDADNNASYQELTFNALTSYNPYNNQYALINSSGNILVSETDAANFQNTSSKEDFLACYGLEYTTTFFDNLKDYNGNVTSDIVYMYDADGNYSVSTGFTAAALQALYEGDLDAGIKFIDGNTITESYDDTLQSEAYYEYMSALETYEATQATYLSLIADAMDEKFDKLCDSAFSLSEQGYSGAVSKISSETSMSNLITYYKNVASLASNCGSLATGDYESYYEDLNSNINSKVNSIQKNGSYYEILSYSYGTDSSSDYQLGTSNGDEYLLVSDSSNNIYIVSRNDEGQYELECKVTNNEIQGYDDDNNNWSTYAQGSYTSTGEDTDNYRVVISGLPAASTGGSAVSVLDWTDSEGTSTTTLYILDPGSAEINVYTKITAESLQAEILDVLASLKNTIYSCWDVDNSAWQETSAAKSAYEAYSAAAQRLGECIYGSGYDPESGDYPPYALLDQISLLYNATAGTGYTEDRVTYNYASFQESFYNIYRNILLDNLMDTYGEPYYTWVDTDSTGKYNGNGEAKYNWYSNLYDKMCSGYQVLLDGLASSADWIKFAFESGIVTMQQIDSFGEWNDLIYSSCSDITEQTDSAAVAKAEAEYNAAMNKIESKDKIYDLELKNIDTEHTSLQTEYDSIKSAIEKNIERSFKLYS